MNTLTVPHKYRGKYARNGGTTYVGGSSYDLIDGLYWANLNVQKYPQYTTEPIVKSITVDRAKIESDALGNLLVNGKLLGSGEAGDSTSIYIVNSLAWNHYKSEDGIVIYSSFPTASRGVEGLSFTVKGTVTVNIKLESSTTSGIDYIWLAEGLGYSTVGISGIISTVGEHRSEDIELSDGTYTVWFRHDGNDGTACGYITFPDLNHPHSHTNKDILDSIDDNRYNNWNDAATLKHNHRNRNVLEEISSNMFDSIRKTTYNGSISITNINSWSVNTIDSARNVSGYTTYVSPSIGDSTTTTMTIYVNGLTRILLGISSEENYDKAYVLNSSGGRVYGYMNSTKTSQYWGGEPQVTSRIEISGNIPPIYGEIFNGLCAYELTTGTYRISYQKDGVSASGYDRAFVYFPDSSFMGTTSDIRLKENIKPADCIDKIKQLGGVFEFDYKKSGLHSIGLIALNVEQSELLSTVFNNLDGFKGINYIDPRFISLALGGVEQLAAEVQLLREEVKRLKQLLNNDN